MRPLPPLARAGGAFTFVGALLVAGYLRFDAGAAGAGRALVAIAWALLGAAVWRMYRSVVRPLVQRRMAEPGGYDAFLEEARREKVAEWEEIRRRGAQRFVLKRASWAALLLWSLAYSAIILMPAVGPLAAGSRPVALRFVTWAAGFAVLACLLAVYHARRTWRRAALWWAAAETGSPPA